MESGLPRHRRACLALALLALVPSCSEPLTGNVAECTSCVIEFADSLLLVAPPGAEPDASSHIRRDERGQLIVAPLSDVSKIGVFAPDGRFIRVLGRRGRGPGEFDEIKDVQPGRGDTLYVLHDDRISVFSLATFEQVRTTTSRTAQMSNRLGVLSDGGVVTSRSSTLSGGPPEDLLWLHRTDAAFPIRAGLPTTDTATVALFVRNDTIWLLRRDYKIFRKTPRGDWNLLTERPLWYAEARQAAREDRGGAHVNDMVVDSDGRIWVLTFVLVQPPKRPPRGAETAERRLATSEWQAFTEPRLDCWNSDGTLYVSAEMADGVAGFADPHHVLHVTEDAAGNDVVSVRRLRVAR